MCRVLVCHRRAGLQCGLLKLDAISSLITGEHINIGAVQVVDGLTVQDGCAVVFVYIEYIRQLLFIHYGVPFVHFKLLISTKTDIKENEFLKE